MAIDERSRHEMYLQLEATLGAQAAATLMEHLPPVGRADVATKRDLDHLERTLELNLTAEFLRHTTSQTRTLFFSIAALMITLVSLTYGAVRLG
jgi:uncharacterized membrane protein (DUF2068 family)